MRELARKSTHDIELCVIYVHNQFSSAIRIVPSMLSKCFDSGSKCFKTPKCMEFAVILPVKYSSKCTQSFDCLTTIHVLFVSLMEREKKKFTKNSSAPFHSCLHKIGKMSYWLLVLVLMLDQNFHPIISLQLWEYTSSHLVSIALLILAIWWQVYALYPFILVRVRLLLLISLSLVKASSYDYIAFHHLDILGFLALRSLSLSISLYLVVLFSLSFFSACSLSTLSFHEQWKFNSLTELPQQLRLPCLQFIQIYCESNGKYRINKTKLQSMEQLTKCLGEKIKFLFNEQFKQNDGFWLMIQRVLSH